MICNILLCKKLVLIGFGDTVATRETECAACHECIAAGSSSDVRGVDMPGAYQLKQGAMGDSPHVGKPEGARPRLTEIYG